MTSKRLYRILLPTVTFLGGVFIQLLLERWVSLGIVTTLSLVLVLISLAFLFTASLHILESIESKFRIVDKNLSSKFEIVNEKLIEIFNHSGLTVNCIEDGKEEISYFRASELINNAKLSLTIVSPWHPFREWQVNTATEGQTHYYQALVRKITEHQNSKSIFHRRIIQVPKEYENNPLEFAKETPFFNCIKHSVTVQTLHPRSCQIRKCPSLLNIHFTIVDQRYIIMPIFTLNQNQRMERYGALIYDDVGRNFVNYLESIYSILESLSQPILTDSLISQ
jgi:hypothetical protein